MGPNGGVCMGRFFQLIPVFLATLLLAVVARAGEDISFRQDALAIEAIIAEHYAYLDRFPGQTVPLTAKLRKEAGEVKDRRSLIRFAERALLTLADHHAITGSALSESWAVVPSYSDVWIERRGGRYVVEAVKSQSPAQTAGVKPGDQLVAVGGVPVTEAIRAFWQDLGFEAADITDLRAGFAARVLAAGRRDRARVLAVQGEGGQIRHVELPSLYAARQERSPVSAETEGKSLVLRIQDALGDERTIAAFDTAMEGVRPGQPVVIDLTDTPSGGNTVVARAIMGWFVDKPTAYQMHNLPGEERRTGIPRQWIEQVLPRPGKYHNGPVSVRVGRWTGSMGEGLAIGLAALGAEVTGDRMAGLLGAIYDFALPETGLVIKLPAERLMAVDGTPRERFAPRKAAHS